MWRNRVCLWVQKNDACKPVKFLKTTSVECILRMIFLACQKILATGTCVHGKSRLFVRNRKKTPVFITPAFWTVSVKLWLDCVMLLTIGSVLPRPILCWFPFVLFYLFFAAHNLHWTVTLWLCQLTIKWDAVNIAKQSCNRIKPLLVNLAKTKLPIFAHNRLVPNFRNATPG